MAKGKTVELGKARIPKDMRVYAIGDIHGCIDELKDLLKLIKTDLKKNPVEKHRLIFIGDYVDRGPDSKAVIDRLIKLREKGHPVTFLRGNHEEKLITAFTAIDRRNMPGFIKYGGPETLQSYGLTGKAVNRILGSHPTKKDYERFSSQVRSHLGKDHVEFLTSLPTSTIEGDYFFCHAGVNPRASFDIQRDYDLIWMREPFLSWDKPLERVVVHGHTPRIRVGKHPHRINVDTSCVYGNLLTAVVLEGKSQRFLQVPAKANYRQGD
ncbi:MAG: metallophosphoesterase family protein [Rhizobiaceae bacterium]